MSGPTKIVNLKGEKGGIYITDTGAHTGLFDCILVHEAAVAALVSLNITGTLTAVVLPAGMAYFGKFTSITLASGKVTAYTAEATT